MWIFKMPPVYFPTCRYYEIRRLRLYLSLFLETCITHFLNILGMLTMESEYHSEVTFSLNINEKEI